MSTVTIQRNGQAQTIENPKWCAVVLSGELSIAFEDDRALSEIAAMFEPLAVYHYRDDLIGLDRCFEGFGKLRSISRDESQGMVVVNLRKGEETPAVTARPGQAEVIHAHLGELDTAVCELAGMIAELREGGDAG